MLERTHIQVHNNIIALLLVLCQQYLRLVRRLPGLRDEQPLRVLLTRV